eukprot:323054_1
MNPMEPWSYSFWNCLADGVGGCLCGFCCTPCYMAKARTRYDHSNCYLNCSCMGSGVIREIVREGYNINGSCEMFKCCCPPCNAIQVNAEVSKRGSLIVNQSKQDATWTSGLFNCCSDGCGSCCYACCCLSCHWAQARTRYDGSSCLSNYCCLGSPAVRNIIREGYGIEGTCVGDVCVTCCCPCCAAIQVNSEVTARGNMKSQRNITHSNTVQQVNTQIVMSTNTT